MPPSERADVDGVGESWGRGWRVVVDAQKEERHTAQAVSRWCSHTHTPGDDDVGCIGQCFLYWNLYSPMRFLYVDYLPLWIATAFRGERHRHILLPPAAISLKPAAQ